MRSARRTTADDGRRKAEGGMQARKQKPHSDVGNKNFRASTDELFVVEWHMKMLQDAIETSRVLEASTKEA